MRMTRIERMALTFFSFIRDDPRPPASSAFY
jgi:hypothetical protein